MILDPLMAAAAAVRHARELVRMRLQLTARIEALTDQAERAPLDDQPLF